MFVSTTTHTQQHHTESDMNAILTTKLNDRKTVVLAKNDKDHGLVACKYVNKRQAFDALCKVSALGIKATIRDRGVVKFIQIL